MPLSDSAVRNAKGRDRPYKMTDGLGLYLLVQTNGSRLWRLAYRFDKKQKTLALGVYPTVGLADARAKRLEARRHLDLGIDPGQVKSSVRSGSKGLPGSFEAVARDWFDAQSSAWVPGHAGRVLSRLEEDAFPIIGKLPIATLEAPQILVVLRAMESRGAIDSAKRMRQTIGAIMRYAIATGQASRNPAADLQGALKATPRAQHFASLKAVDLPDFLQRLATYDGEETTRLAVELILHTMVRTNEMRFAEWKEFENLGSPNALWRIPAERMKMQREHIVPLTPEAQTILARLRDLTPGARWIAPGRSAGKPMSQNTMLFAIYRLGYHSRLTVHGFRGTASTILNEREFNPDWIEMQLAHAPRDAIRAAYNSAQWLTQRREMMEWWSKFLVSQAEVGSLLG
jgi:integrase